MDRFLNLQLQQTGPFMNSIIYIVGLVVIVLAALSFFGLR
ncbi:LPXTG cell wall anchor domain-containing protein [Hydrogenophaga sp. SL48]|nr:LPXTG cell wall anchor domain-containing protein [Hydrogenophaga sp. SL48]UJW82071.1 LPXTG cell wall anchor domain-containing protein [Hydrogenophaga sp. SL48]